MEKLYNFTERGKGARKLSSALIATFSQPKNGIKTRWTIKDVLAVLKVIETLDLCYIEKINEGNMEFGINYGDNKVIGYIFENGRTKNIIKF